MANLYDKAGLVNIPVGYQDGFLYNIKPEDNTLGFRFNRDSAATLVNKEGLIEQVGYFGPELVQNGNFSEIGPELVTNGDFVTDSDWTKGTGWSISDGKAVAVLANNTNLQQNQNTVANKTYKVVYTVSDYQNGSVRFQFSGGGNTLGATVSANGTYTEYIKSTLNHNIYRFKATSSEGGFTGSIDNVSVKEVGQNWTFATNWSVGDGKAVSDGSANNAVAQNISFNPSTLKIKFDVSDLTQGSVRLFVNKPAFTQLINVGSNGSYETTVEVTSGANNIYFYSTNNFIGSIDNVSVTEVLGDKPRIDYTDSLTSPSFLLEPQSTNLITYSEDFSQPAWNKSNTSIQINTTTSPSGNFDGSTLTDNATSSIHRLRDTVSLSASTNYSLSVFAKKNTLSNIQLALINTANSNTISKVFDLENGVIGEELSQGGTTVLDAKIENYGNGWFRCIIVGQLNSAPNQYQITLATQSTGNSQSIKQVTYSGDGTGSVFLYGAQIEQLSYPTSYIPTFGSTATRAQETCNGAGNASTFNSTEGVLYAEIAALADDLTFRSISINANDTRNDQVMIRYRTNSNVISFFIRDGGSVTLNQNVIVQDITKYNKLALKYKNGDISAWINGVEYITSTATGMPSGLSRIGFQLEDPNVNPFFGKVKGVYVFNEALTDDELQQLTGPEYNSFAALAAAYNYTVI